MTENLEADQTPEELRNTARTLLARSGELCRMADDLTRHAEALLELAEKDKTATAPPPKPANSATPNVSNAEQNR